MKAHYLLFLFVLISFIILTDARKKCLKKNCAKNEVFRCTECLEGTCGEKEGKPKVDCVQICKYKECRCKVGFVRHNGICIPTGACPLTTTKKLDCKIDEFEYLQLSIFDENLTCRNREKSLPTPFPSSASSNAAGGKLRCVCAKGRVRNAKGKCILSKDCTETDNKHIYEKTFNNNNSNNNSNKKNNNNIKNPSFRLPTTNYLNLQKKPIMPLLSKVPKRKDVKMPKFFMIPPPASFGT